MTVPDELLEDADPSVLDAIELARVDPLYPFNRWYAYKRRVVSAEHALSPALYEVVYWLALFYSAEKHSMKVAVHLARFNQPFWVSDTLHKALDQCLDFSVGPVVLFLFEKQHASIGRKQERRFIALDRKYHRRALLRRRAPRTTKRTP